tara:strand:+ start:245 stop:418 length:174 start_codon:yes stop_codon:yes gene_type:complete
MGVSKGEKLGVCVKCGKKGVYTKSGWEFGYGRNAKVCRYCKQQHIIGVNDENQQDES